jgi:hypothetical protein
MSYSPQQTPDTTQGTPVTSLQGSPVFYRVSTDKDPSHKTLQIQSDAMLTYAFNTQQGVLIGVSQAPDGISPHVATWSFGIPYPAFIIVDVFDSATGVPMGESQLQLFGQDVFKVRVAYPSNTPAANGWIDAMVNGHRQSVYGGDYMQTANQNEDVWTRGSGN